MKTKVLLIICTFFISSSHAQFFKKLGEKAEKFPYVCMGKSP